MALQFRIRTGYPDFLDLHWDKPLSRWNDCCDEIVDIPRGISRHPVVFVIYSDALFAFKELPSGVAEKEYDSLLSIEKRGLPVVKPVGFVDRIVNDHENSVLITEYLTKSIPYRLLLFKTELQRYRKHLLDAIANLMVELHITGVYWGDCSLSNALFRRDAGKLQAYLVDAETVEIFKSKLSPLMRHQDLEIMERNIDREINSLVEDGLIVDNDQNFLVADTGAYIRLRYQELWEEITREETIRPGENFRIQNRIRALNELGFSVGDISLVPTEGGNELRFRIAVTDRNYYRKRLKQLTGLDAEEYQARLLMNEIQEHKAALSHEQNRDVSITEAATSWLESIFLPITEQLQNLISEQTTIIELYCQVLEHKWYLSERAQHDVGHAFAVKDFLEKYGKQV